MKNLKIGLKLWSINNYKYNIVELYNNNFFDYIELYTVPDTLETLQYWSEFDIPYIIHAPHFAHGLNLSKKECFKINIKISNEVKKFADKLKAKYIIFHGGAGGCIKETARQLSYINDERILIENKPYKAIPEMKVDYCIGSKPEEIEYILKKVNIGFCCDFGHAIAAANSYNIEPYEYIKRFFELQPRLYHLSDTDMTSELDFHYNFGKGNMDVKKILDLLPDNAYTTIETNKKSKENLNDFIKDVKFLHQFLI